VAGSHVHGTAEARAHGDAALTDLPQADTTVKDLPPSG
jgi:hypothetical protein